MTSNYFTLTLSHVVNEIQIRAKPWQVMNRVSRYRPINIKGTYNVVLYDGSALSPRRMRRIILTL